MRVVVLVGVGLALMLWLRFTRRVQDAPAWKPPDRTITNNRSRR